jgi:hypothetical protein
MPRRIFAVAAAGALALVALTGCRLEAGSAAFVGDTRYTSDYVNEMALAYVDDLKANGHDTAPTAAQLTGLRKEIAADLIFRDVAKEYSDSKNYLAPSFDYDSVTGQFGVKANDPYLQLAVQADAYRAALLGRVRAKSLTDDDYKSVYDFLLAEGAVTSDATYASIKASLQDQSMSDAIAKAITLRGELTIAANKYGAEINPGFAPGSYPLASATSQQGSTIPLVVLTFGSGGNAPAVRDVSTPDTTS